MNTKEKYSHLTTPMFVKFSEGENKVIFHRDIISFQIVDDRGYRWASMTCSFANFSKTKSYFARPAKKYFLKLLLVDYGQYILIKSY